MHFCKARRQAGGDVRPKGANPPGEGDTKVALPQGMCDQREQIPPQQFPCDKAPIFVVSTGAACFCKRSIIKVLRKRSVLADLYRTGERISLRY